ncbi:MAG: DUF4234 domain-containing protein [Candidatus Sericytochromatia bacterium]|nr:DUF4234 domain-containing protein [Candidatus Sericytochromatia bacterium]
MMEQNPLLSPQQSDNAFKAVSYGKTLQKVILLNYLTFGLYSFYWFYRNWKDFRGKIWLTDGPPPWLFTLGLLVPFLGIYLLYRQFSQINEYIPPEAAAPRTVAPLLLSLLWFSQAPLNRMSARMDWPEPIATLFILVLSTFVLASFQRNLNAYWQYEQPESPLQNRFGWGEKICLGLGFLVWATFLVGVFFLS